MKISLIVPFYNRELTLNRLLDSILSQTHLPDEILLVDNHSTDGSVLLAKAFADQLKGHVGCSVQLLDCMEKGAAAARNVGLQQAVGDYVYFFDSDDVLSADFFERVYTELTLCPVDLLVFRTRIVKRDGTLYIRRHGFSTRPSYQILSSFLSTQSMVVRRSFLLSAGGWNEKIFYWNDWELGVRLLRHHPTMRYVKHPAYHLIYAHADSITGILFKEKTDSILYALQMVYEECKEDKECKENKALYLRKAIMAGMVCREGDKNKGLMMLRYSFTTSRTISMMEKILYFYTSRGGRAAWKIACFLVINL